MKDFDQLTSEDQNRLAAFGISKGDLYIIMKTSLHKTLDLVFQDAEVIINKFGIKVNDWIKLCRSPAHRYPYHYLKSLISSHEKLLKIKILTTAQLVEIGLNQNSHPPGDTIEAVCKHYEKLKELKIESADLVEKIYRAANTEFINFLVDKNAVIKEMNLSSHEICLIWDMDFPIRKMELLCQNYNSLKILGITEPGNFAQLAKNLLLNNAIKALLKHRRSLMELGITSASDLARMASCYSIPKALDALFDNLEPIKKFGLTTVADIVSLVSTPRAAQTIEVISQYRKNLHAIGFTSDIVKLLLIDNAIQYRNLQAVAEYGLTLKERLKFNVEDFTTLVKAQRDIPGTINLLVNLSSILINIPKQELIRVVIYDALLSVRESRLRALSALYPPNPTRQQTNHLAIKIADVQQERSNSTVTSSTSLSTLKVIQPAAAQPNSIVKQLEQLKSIVQMQTLALLEMTKTNETLLRELAELKNEKQISSRKRPNEECLDDNPSDFLDSFAKEPNRATFFTR